VTPSRRAEHTVAVVGPLTAPFVKVDITSDITVPRDHDGDHDHDGK